VGERQAPTYYNPIFALKRSVHLAEFRICPGSAEHSIMSRPSITEERCAAQPLKVALGEIKLHPACPLRSKISV
jgi:hypothetical protein